MYCKSSVVCSLCFACQWVLKLYTEFSCRFKSTENKLSVSLLYVREEMKKGVWGPRRNRMILFYYQRDTDGRWPSRWRAHLELSPPPAWMMACCLGWQQSDKTDENLQGHRHVTELITHTWNSVFLWQWQKIEWRVDIFFDNIVSDFNWRSFSCSLQRSGNLRSPYVCVNMLFSPMK